jgi:hypothetical protein
VPGLALDDATTRRPKWRCLTQHLRRLFWRVVDHLDYALTLARLRVLDAVAGPEPETPGDQKREKDREQIEREFPKIATPED